MLQKLHKLASLEKQGLGTAYEYYVKIRLLKHLLREFKPHTVLVYGMPEKYGYSLDFFWQFRGSKIYVYEDRIVRLKKCLDNIEKAGLKKPEIIKKVDRDYDLIVSCEALQRMNQDRYVTDVLNHGRRAVIFVPNKSNARHESISGLEGLALNTLQNRFLAKGGYIDMPPFPPGIKARKKPKWYHFAILRMWAHIEWLLPFKKRFAHICYVFKPGL